MIVLFTWKYIIISSVENKSSGALENNSYIEDISNGTLQNNSNVENNSGGILENYHGLPYGLDSFFFRFGCLVQCA